MKSVIIVRNVSVIYPNGTKALKNVSLEVASKDNIFCLMGPNGAGKTTLVKVLSTQLRPAKGYVEVLGYDLYEFPEKIRKEIAILPQEGRPLSEATPWEFVYWLLIARGWSFKEAKQRTITVLKEFDLWKYKDKPCMILSGGTKRRVLISAAVAAEASLTFLDEPTLGLDPYSRRNTWKLLLQLKNESFFFITTNLGLEAEMLASTVGILQEGTLTALGQTNTLKENLPYKYKLILDLNSPSYERIASRENTLIMEMGDKMIIYAKNRDILENIVEEISLNSSEISISVSPTDLEDYFVLSGRINTGGGNYEK
ncbi:ABC transporter ATP-binding protein [Thermococcus sp.]|uniref:ABC transporter ATP-binding protein n=1 Tax=Thermococcus sp. TaxID=35749 RepID=UPI00262CA91B|nr:ABC transporter ATP-binding protein [Thermococcus sp.]